MTCNSSRNIGAGSVSFHATVSGTRKYNIHVSKFENQEHRRFSDQSTKLPTIKTPGHTLKAAGENGELEKAKRVCRSAYFREGSRDVNQAINK